MSEIWTMGELLVEIMRPEPGLDLCRPGPFVGPFPSGAPGIFIDTAARLGRTAVIVSGVGDDDFGRCILNRFRRDGVNTDFIEVFPGKSTGVAFVSYQESGSRSFIFHWDGTPAVMAQVPPADRVKAPAFFHVMGCSLMANDVFRERVFEAVGLFASRGARITFDPNIRFELLRDRSVQALVAPILRHCAILFPGEKELELLSGQGDPARAAEALFEHYPLETIVLKRGSRGCRVYPRAGEALDVPAFPVCEKDPTGAGDCFDAGYLCGVLEGRTEAEAARVASACGALNAQAFGPMEGDIRPETVEAMLEQA